MAKLYGPEFEAGWLSPHPKKPIAYDSIDAALKAYVEFLGDCEHYGQTPNNAWLYIGSPDGDEETCGYPDYPDYIIEYKYEVYGEYGEYGEYTPTVVRT